MLSIIVPVYNAKDYLETTASSVLNQTYKDLELIFVNDGSKDGSDEILNQLKAKEKRVKVFSQKNKGVTAARKLGWLNAKGKYLVFLDADDLLPDNSLETLVTEIQNNNLDIVNASFVAKPSNKIWEHKTLGELNKEEYANSLIFGNTFGVLYASIYRRSIFEESTFSFDSSVKIGEDVLMNLELCKRIQKVKNIKDIVYHYTDDNMNSAMKIIIRHPLYYIKFNKIRNQLIKDNSTDLFNKINNKLSIQDNKTIVKSFFSPFIDFDNKTYLAVKNEVENDKESNFLLLCLKNKYLSIIVKKIIYVLFVVENLGSNKKYKNKVIIR